jgi:hypothetical protein
MIVGRTPNGKSQVTASTVGAIPLARSNNRSAAAGGEYLWEPGGNQRIPGKMTLYQLTPYWRKTMKRPMFTLILIATILGSALPLMAQQKRISPHETISTRFGRNLVMVVYGRPYTKDPKTGDVRKIWGGLVPYGKVWRTGADEATLLITQKPLVMGDTTIPAGAYTLFTLPNEDGTCQLIINKQIGQWGLQYDQKQDLARIDLKKDALDAPVDQFTMALDKDPSGGGILKLSWENTQFSVPFTVQK